MIWQQALLVCYFLALVASSLKTVRFVLDAKRTGQGFYWIGVPANLALVTITILLSGSAGDNPAFRGDWLRIAIRLAFIAWACLALLLEVLYLRTFVRVKRHEPINGENETE